MATKSKSRLHETKRLFCKNNWCKKKKWQFFFTLFYTEEMEKRNSRPDTARSIGPGGAGGSFPSVIISFNVWGPCPTVVYVFKKRVPRRQHCRHWVHVRHRVYSAKLDGVGKPAMRPLTTRCATLVNPLYSLLPGRVIRIIRLSVRRGGISRIHTCLCPILATVNVWWCWNYEQV